MRNHRTARLHPTLLAFLLLFCTGLLVPAHGGQDAGGAVTVVAGNGQPGFTDGTGEAARFNKPIRLAPFGKGRIVVADINNHAIRVVDREGRVTTISGGPDRKGIQDGSAAEAKFDNPHGVAVSPDGAIAVAGASSHLVRLITPVGAESEPRRYEVTTVAGVPGVSGLQDGPAGEALFNSPHAVAWDDAGGILVVDIGNASVRRIKDGTVTTVVGPGEGGMAMPIDMSLTAEGDVLLADAASNTVLRKPVGGALQPVTMSGTLAVPHGVASDSAGNVYVAEIRGHRVSKISPSGEVSAVAGTGEAGGGPDQLNKPAAVLVHDGLLWIADLENHRILTLPLAP